MDKSSKVNTMLLYNTAHLAAITAAKAIEASTIAETNLEEYRDLANKNINNKIEHVIEIGALRDAAIKSVNEESVAILSASVASKVASSADESNIMISLFATLEANRNCRDTTTIHVYTREESRNQYSNEYI